MKNTTKDYILIGDNISNFFGIAMNTLWITFILSMGMNVYQFVNVAQTVLGLATATFILAKSDKIIRWAYSHYRSFLVIEGVTTAIAAVLTATTGSVLVIIIISLAMTPFGKIQRMSNNRLMKESFTPDERERHDNKDSTIGQYIQLAGLGVGFVANMFIAPHIGVTISLVGEVINNFFYWKQYNLAQARKKEERDAA